MISMPPPRTPDAMKAPALRWGVMGTGWIADRFVVATTRHTRQHFVAVASRNADRAEEFAAAHEIERSYGSYEALVADPEVDVIYVATGHAAHLPNARLAIAGGKHVLVEKPIGLDAEQAEELCGLAGSHGTFFAEALWSAFLPRWDIVRQILDAGVLGEIHTVSADLGERFLGTDHRILDPNAAGGPLLDLGTYPLAFIEWVLGEPSHVHAIASTISTGVAGQVSATFEYDNGAQAVMSTGLVVDTPTTAFVAGTEATLTLPRFFYHPGEVVLDHRGGPTLSWSEPHVGHEALYWEAAETARCIAAGATQTPLRSWSDSIATMRLQDAVRAACGISYERTIT